MGIYIKEIIKKKGSKMTDNILGLVKDFLNKNNIGDIDLSKIVKNLPVDEILSMVKGNDEYVVKKSGNIEKYDRDKISRSIKNAADRSEIQLNSSDLDIILDDLAKKIFGDGDKRVQKTTDIKDIVRNVLDKAGYSKVRQSYDSYVKDQN